MSETANLALPVLEAAQAQKHVTHNEALRVLDGAVQLAVLSRNVNAPPTSPAAGARYLVGSSPTGAFAAHAGDIALWEDGAWRFLVPRAGWRLFVVDEPAFVIRDGSTWKQIGAYVTGLSGLAELGVGTAPDATNKLAAKLNAALFVAKSIGEGGTGDLRVNFSKQASGNTLSHIFQTDFSGRAEIGLTGDDKLRLRVSADGATWRDALIADAGAAAVSLHTSAQERLRVDSSGNVGVGTAAPDAKLDVRGRILGGFGADTTGGTLDWNHSSNARPGSGFTLLTGDAANGPGPASQYFHAFSFEYSTKSGAGNLTQFAIPYGFGASIDAGVHVRGRYEGAWSAWRKLISEGASGYVGVGVASPSTKLHVDGPIRCGSYTVGTAPSASAAGAGAQIYVSNETGGAVPAFSDGTNWRRVTDRAVIA